MRFAQKFTGKERDSESGLDYFGARYYGSALGRFTSPDPAGIFVADLTNPQSWNLYSYVWNNPLANVDPTGMSCVNTNNGPADDGDGQGCADAGVKPGDPSDLQHPVTNQGQINATAYGSDNAASLEMQDALSAFGGRGVKNIEYLPSDPFTKDFQRSLGMVAITEAMKASCQAGNQNGNLGVGTGEAFVNTVLDQVLPNGFESISEAQLGAFNATFSISGNSASVTVTNPISINSALLHIFSGGGAVLSAVGQNDAGQYFAQLGQKSGNGRFATVHQTLHIVTDNPCR